MEVQDENALHAYQAYQANKRLRSSNRVVLGTVTNQPSRMAAKAASETALRGRQPAPVHRPVRPLQAQSMNVINESNRAPEGSDTETEPSENDDSYDGTQEELGPEDEEEEEEEVYEDNLHHDLDNDMEDEEDPALASSVPDNQNPYALYPICDAESKHTLEQLALTFANMPGVYDEQDEDSYDVAMVAEYADDIFDYIRKVETQMSPDPHYMARQNEIHWPMRAILVDWLVQVHHRFGLLPETLYLTINYIDRFLSVKVVSLTKFQLVGAVALFLAAKYEEINCPSVKDIAYMVDHGYTDEEILRAEWYMIDLLQFDLGWPGPMSFLRRTSKADDYDLETRTLAKYLLETTIMDRRFVGAPPSWVAAASHCLSRRMLQRGEWTDAHIYFSGYTYRQLEPAIDVILHGLQDPLTHHKAIYEKYADRKFKRASVYVKNWMDRAGLRG